MIKSKRKFTFVTTLVLVVFLLCSTLGAAAQDVKVALIMKTLSNPFFLSMEEGAERGAEEFNIDLISTAGDAETSVAQQVNIITDMISQQVDVIAIAPADSQAVVPALKQAKEAGIHVINLDNRINKEAAMDNNLEIDTFISANNETGAKMATTYLASLLGGQGKVAMLEGIPGVENAEARKRGFVAGAELFDGIEIVASQTANWATEEALNVFTNMLQANPDIKGLFAANDMMALGAIQAIEAAGKTGEIFVTSYDNLDAAQEAIQADQMQATVEQNPALMGYYGMKFARELVEGEEVPQEYMVPLKLITKLDL